MARGFAVACALVLLAGTGCVQLKPWERDVLARDDMAWDPDASEAKIRSHVHDSKEASLPGGSVGGGGCGCN